jgi:hypothetical protein
MSDISGSSDTKIKQKTIAQAILEVMGETKRSMTSQEICQLILEKNLYHFNTDNPLKMVQDALKRHAIDSKVKKASPHRYFEQNDKHWFITQVLQKSLENNNNISMIDFEASLYDYIFDFEE